MTTIKGQQLFKDGNYLQKYGTTHMCSFLHIHMEDCKGISLASGIQTYDHRRKTTLYTDQSPSPFWMSNLEIQKLCTFAGPNFLVD